MTFMVSSSPNCSVILCFLSASGLNGLKWLLKYFVHGALWQVGTFLHSLCYQRTQTTARLQCFALLEFSHSRTAQSHMRLQCYSHGVPLYTPSSACLLVILLPSSLLSTCETWSLAAAPLWITILHLLGKTCPSFAQMQDSCYTEPLLLFTARAQLILNQSAHVLQAMHWNFCLSERTRWGEIASNGFKNRWEVSTAG